MTYDEQLKEIKGPDKLVMDIYEELYSFFRLVSELKTLKPELTDIFETIIDILHREEIIAISIDEFCMEIANCGTHEESDDAELLSLAVRRLSHDVLNWIKLMGLYDENGILNYKFSYWLDPVSPVLEKYLETD